MMTTNGLYILLILCVAWIPLARASSILSAKVDYAYCTGNLTLNLISASCEDETCTYGSDVSLYGQVNATTNLPKNAKISVYPTIPNAAFTGIFSVYELETSNICSHGTNLTAPAGTDAGYSCPKAGLYNMHTLFSMWGSPDAWYASLYGFNIGFVLKIRDLDEDEQYSICYLTATVQDGDGGNVTTSAGFLGLVGLSGLAAGLILQKRKNREEVVSKGRAEEDGNHFELISDPAGRV